MFQAIDTSAVVLSGLLTVVRQQLLLEDQNCRYQSGKKWRKRLQRNIYGTARINKINAT